MPSVAEIVQYLENFAPPGLAAEWDNVGLLLGDDKAEVARLMTCLTLVPDTAAEAVEAGAQLIVTHHPILFRPVKQLTTHTSEGRMLLGLIRAGVAVYSPHTAFDNAEGGINDILARRLGLQDVAPLRPGQAPGQCKVVVFVPEKDLERVADAMFGAGAGWIGEYGECSFRLAGTGTFHGSEAANPTVGRKGQRESVGEWRLEVVCPERSVPQVVAAMRRVHSYEEPAFDVYPLRPSVAAQGEGRVGRLPRVTPLAQLARQVKENLHTGAVQLVGDPDRSAERVAIACGAAGEFLPDAVQAGADVFLTGEARFHDYLAAHAQGIGLILPGHYASERIGVEALAERLQAEWPNLDIWPSRRERDPVHWI